jgi:Family of unknown function (DUF6455)
MVSASLQPSIRPIYVSKMMERLGIDPSGGVVPQLSLLYATAFHHCESCPSTQACRDWLDWPLGSASFAPPFCPIGDILSELQFRQVKRTASVAAASEMRRIRRNKASPTDGKAFRRREALMYELQVS